MDRRKAISSTAFTYHLRIETRLQGLHSRIQDMRAVGKLSPAALRRIRKYFKIKGIYHSNAIEGNALTIGETRLVVEMGMTLTGRTLRDQAEASNLSAAMDFMEGLAVSRTNPITLSDLRQIHALILKGIDDEYAGIYRRGEVAISGSDYRPPAAHLLNPKMGELGAYIQQITLPAAADADLPILAAAAAHAWLAQIHPFADGNGRTARVLMNLILMRRGYPICIIARDDRQRYYEALEESQAGDLTDLIELVYENVEESLEEWEKAAEEQRREQEWLESITAGIEGPVLTRARNEYAIWLTAMDLLKNYFKQTIDSINEMTLLGSIYLNFRDYGMLSFEKYLSLRDEKSAKRTWFFGIDFKAGAKRARYLFFFGYADYTIRRQAPVVLLIAKDTADYGYELLLNISQSNIPDIHQIGFNLEEQTFVALTLADSIQKNKVENFAKTFFEQVVQRDFGG